MVEVPSELVNWVKDQLAQCEEASQRAATANANTDRSAQAWVLDVLGDLHQIATEAKRAEVALSAWAIQTETAGASKVASATGVSISTAMSRAGGAKAVGDLRSIFK